MPPSPRFRIEAAFEITSIRTGSQKGGKSVILGGRLVDLQDAKRFDSVTVQHLEVHLHTNDGQSPYPLGHKLRIYITDEQ